MKDFLEKMNWVTILGVLVAVEMQIGSGSMSISHMFPAAWIPGIQEAMGDLGSIGALIMSAGAFGRMPGAASGQPSITPTIVKILIAALLLSTFLFVPPAMAQTPRPRPALTGDLVKDTKAAIDQKNAAFAAANPAGPNDPNVSCDFNIFLGLTPKNLESAIKKCVSDGVGTLVDDTTRALDSAKSYGDSGKGDGDAINCLTPGLAILKAGVIIPAIAEVKDASGNVTTPAVPAKAPGLILLFQKYREFVLAGGLTSCKTWVDTAVNATATQAVNSAAGIVGAALLLPK